MVSFQAEADEQGFHSWGLVARREGMDREFAKDLGALGEIFSFLRKFSRDQELDGESEFCMNLVAEEIFTNAVKYGAGTSDHVSISLARIDDRLYFELIDFGAEPFDPADLGPLDLDAPIEKRRAGGLGLHLVRSLVDDLLYEYEGGNLKVIVTKQLES